MSATRIRNRVVAEITLAHIRQLAPVFGCAASEQEVLMFLNENGHAYDLWMCMMQAAERFIETNLRTGLTTARFGQLKQKPPQGCYLPPYSSITEGMSDLNKNLSI